MRETGFKFFAFVGDGRDFGFWILDFGLKSILLSFTGVC
jgi:hypothetical protein